MAATMRRVVLRCRRVGVAAGDFALSQNQTARPGMAFRRAAAVRHEAALSFATATAPRCEGGTATGLQQSKGIKRFFTNVDVAPLDEPVDGMADDARFMVQLDGRALKSPAKRHLRLPTAPLATAVAIEWESVPDKLEPTLMPLMTAVSTVTDYFPQNRERTTKELSKYLLTDTVCIRADPHDKDLYTRQCEDWDPLVNWMHESFDCKISVTSAIGRPTHAEDAVDKIVDHMGTLSDFQLQALFMATTVCKSLTIGLAVVHGRLSIKEAIAAARIEEEHQIEQWGMVEGGHDVDRAHISVQVSAASVLMQLCE